MKRRWLLLGALVLGGCRTATEVVVRIDTVGGKPSIITLKLHRSTPFNENAVAPPFVESVLDGADLDLLITPPSGQTVLSLLPAKGAPPDLAVTASAPGFLADPSDAQNVTFSDGQSKELRFTLTAIPPDAGARDLRVRDASAGPIDASLLD